LGQSQGRRAPRLDRLARHGPRLGPHGPSAAAGHALDVHRGRRRLPRPGRLQPAPPPSPLPKKRSAGARRPERFAWLEAVVRCSPSSSSSGSSPSSTPSSTTCISTGPERSSAPRPRQGGSASPATGSCRS
jgi:hypothetical protein